MSVAGDSTGFLDTVASLPEQLAAAREAAAELDLSSLPKVEDVRNIVVLGMGGSGIAGEVMAAVANGSLPVPVTVLKQYRTPAFVGPHTLAFALSYSGETEETRSMTAGAVEAGARVVSIGCPGALATEVVASGGVHIPCPDGYMPRAALGALVAPLFVTLFRTGLLPEAHALLVGAQQQLGRRRDACVPGVEGVRNPARELARRIGRTIPLVYGGGALGAVAAMRWKADVNENAKAPAFWNAHPELDHNELSGWGQHGDVTRQIFTLVELRHGFEHARLTPRFDGVRAQMEECVAQVLEVRAEGENRLAQVLDLMYVGDWTSCYLALENDVDPGPIAAITALKHHLARS
jgi:glucose/mannose-6-phosphate isomerase